MKRRNSGNSIEDRFNVSRQELRWWVRPFSKSTIIFLVVVCFPLYLIYGLLRGAVDGLATGLVSWKEELHKLIFLER